MYTETELRLIRITLQFTIFFLVTDLRFPLLFSDTRNENELVSFFNTDSSSGNPLCYLCSTADEHRQHLARVSFFFQ